MEIFLLTCLFLHTNVLSFSFLRACSLLLFECSKNMKRKKRKKNIASQHSSTQNQTITLIKSKVNLELPNQHRCRSLACCRRSRKYTQGLTSFQRQHPSTKTKSKSSRGLGSCFNLMMIQSQTSMTLTFHFSFHKLCSANKEELRLTKTIRTFGKHLNTPTF